MGEERAGGEAKAGAEEGEKERAVVHTPVLGRQRLCSCGLRRVATSAQPPMAPAQVLAAHLRHSTAHANEAGSIGQRG